MSKANHPTAEQRRFFERHILGEEHTILTVKRIYEPRRNSSTASDVRKIKGFSVNIRGPFKLVEYQFETSEEVVIDASWAGGSRSQESSSHLHCYWKDVKFARLSRASDAVKKNINYQFQL